MRFQKLVMKNRAGVMPFYACAYLIVTMCMICMTLSVVSGVI